MEVSYYQKYFLEFEYTEEAREFIRGLQGPTAFVAIAGGMRTGKSTYLNRGLLGQKTGFGVESTTNSCTKGIWIWTGVIPRYSSKEGETISIIVADTEGLGSLDADPNYVKKLGSLALSISSHFIYNSLGTIGNDAINNLWLTTQNAK